MWKKDIDADMGPAKLKIDLGRRWICAQQIANLKPGAIIELDSPADDSVDVFVGSRLWAKGSLVRVKGNLCVRVRDASCRLSVV